MYIGLEGSWSSALRDLAEIGNLLSAPVSLRNHDCRQTPRTYLWCRRRCPPFLHSFNRPSSNPPNPPAPLLLVHRGHLIMTFSTVFTSDHVEFTSTSRLGLTGSDDNWFSVKISVQEIGLSNRTFGYHRSERN